MVVSYCRAKHLSIGITVDILAVGLLIGQVIGRWGNFVNGEAFGSVTNLPWAMTVKTDGSIVALNVHPTFIYESLWNFVGIGVLLLYKRIKKFNGELFCAYMVWYGMGRAWIGNACRLSLHRLVQGFSASGNSNCDIGICNNYIRQNKSA